MEKTIISTLALTDRILCNALQSAGVQKSSLFAARGALDSAPMADAATVTVPDGDLPALDDMKTGQEIYDFWMQLSAFATETAKSCTESYNEAAAKLIALEDNINRCYAEGDRLKKDYETAEARKKGLDAKISAAQTDIGNMERSIQDLERKIRDLKKKKKTYDVLRWFPVINIISSIIEAIEGVEEDLNRKQRERSNRQTDLTRLYSELQNCSRELAEITRKIAENKGQIIKLEAERTSFQAERNDAAKEMIQWKDREQYYLNLAGEMKHLIAIEADISEFKKLIADNPPAFQLAA